MTENRLFLIAYFVGLICAIFILWSKLVVFVSETGVFGVFYLVMSCIFGFLFLFRLWRFVLNNFF